MEHSHTHHEVLPGNAGHLSRIFLWGIGLNLVYVLVEGVAGFITSSMGLLSDAGHNLSDVASLVISLLAVKAAEKKPTANFTYGFKKATIAASVANAVILYAAVAFILVESISKLASPHEVDGAVVAWVAAVGVVINGITAWILMKDSRHDLNVKGSFLHMLSDTAVSVGVVISGIVIACTGWTVIDPIIGIIIALIIAVGSYSMLRDSVRLMFDGVPREVSVKAVREAIAATPGVRSFHHLHIWALSTTEAAMTVHVVVASPEMVDEVIHGVKEAVAPLGVAHSTIEAELNPDDCD